jgi:hypothetical protein
VSGSLRAGEFDARFLYELISIMVFESRCRRLFRVFGLYGGIHAQQHIFSFRTLHGAGWVGRMQRAIDA